MKVCRVGLLLAAALSLPSGRVRLLATSAGVRAKSCASSWGAKQLDVSVPVPDWLSFHGVLPSLLVDSIVRSLVDTKLQKKSGALGDTAYGSIPFWKTGCHNP